MIEWTASRWTTEDENSQKVFIDRIKRFEGFNYAVRNSFGFVLSKDGYFEMEPQPSNRDNKFYARCRFSSIEDAKKAYELWHSKK